MKKIFTLLVFLMMTLFVFGQPQKMSYQCVVRDPGGVLVTNHSVGVKISILYGNSPGTVVYQEIYNPNPQTNTNGLLSLEIGGGIAITGTFSQIDWANGPYFIKTETDPTGGTNYTIVGTSQLLSVPYALHAKVAATADYSTLTNLPSLNIANWNTAYGWGNHAGLYRPVGWVPSWTDISSKPAFATVATSGSYSDLTNKPTILNSQWTTLGYNIYYSTGMVGIGTSAPTKALTVSHGGGDGLLVKSTAGFSVIDIDAFNGDADLRFFKAGALMWDIRNQPTTDNLEFYEGGVGTRMIIQNTTGNIGVGISSPSEKIDVIGNIEVSGDYMYSTSKIDYYHVGCSEFAARNGDIGSWALHGDQEYGTFAGTTGTWRSFATVHLPDGAVVDEVRLYYVDCSANNMTIYFRVTSSDGITHTNLGSATSSETDSPGAPIARQISFNPNVTINNANNRYTLIYESAQSDNNHRLYNVRIRYTINKL